MLQLRVEYRIEVAPQHRADGVPGCEITHCEGNERDTDDHEDQADKPFDQKLNHLLPLTSLTELKFFTR